MEPTNNQNSLKNTSISIAESAKNRRKISENVTEFTFLGYNTLVMNTTVFNENT